MFDEFNVSDVDIHIVEPADLWQKYIDRSFLDEAPIFVMIQESGLMKRLMVAGKMVTKIAGKNRMTVGAMGLQNDNLMAWYGELVEMGWSPEAQILGMNGEGVDLAFLYPSGGLSVLANDDISPALSLAIAQAYNNWLNDFASHNRERMKHIAMVPLQNPAGAVKEIRRCSKDFGSKGIVVRGEPNHGRILDDPDYKTVWNEIESLDLAVGLHHGTHSLVSTLGAQRFSTRFQSHTLSHPMEQMANLVAFIGSGVLEMHPKLRIAFLESGGGWLPYMLWRFDEQYDQLASIEAPQLKLKPSEYFQRQCWISVEPEEPHLDVLVDYIGHDCTVISSDFPHGDHRPQGLKTFSQRTDIPKEVIKKTFWENTMRLYSL